MVQENETFKLQFERSNKKIEEQTSINSKGKIETILRLKILLGESKKMKLLNENQDFLSEIIRRKRELQFFIRSNIKYFI